MYEPIPLTPAQQFDPIAQLMAHRERRDNVARVGVGAGMLLAALGVAYGISQMYDSDARLTHDMPFSQQVQEVVVNIDDGLAAAGAVGLVAGLGAVGAAKVLGGFNARARFADKISSKEMTNDGKKRTWPRRLLERACAGGVPVLAGTGVMLGTMTAAIGTEVSEGPSRPIEAFGNVAPGQSMIVQYPELMPMLEGSISPQLARAVEQEAARRGLRATPLDLNLGNLKYSDQTNFDLVMGVPTAPGSPLDWKPADGCQLVPVVLDQSANIPLGAKLTVSGVEAQVAGHLQNTSAMTRIGVAMNAEALKTCLAGNPDQGEHAVILDTDTNTAAEILQTAQAETGLSAPAAVITKEHYKQNSTIFWESNAKPITNTQALMSLALTLTAMGAAMGGRLLRNRREWEGLLARGLSKGQLRATELLRSAKDGLAATFWGTALALPITPLVGFVEAGFRAGVGFKEVLVGAAVGTVGSVLGGLSRLWRLKTIKPKEATRV